MRNSNFMLLILPIIIEFVISNKESIEEELKQNKINIIGTYSGFCGFAAMKKKKIIEEIKRQLINNYFIDQNKIEVKTINVLSLSSQEKFKIKDLNINFTEFNIFIFYKNKKFLVGTSFRDLKEYYYEFLGGIIGADSKSFYDNFTQKINKIIEEIDKVQE